MYLKTLFLFLIALAICSTAINGQNHHILSVYPTANFIGAARNSSITLQLDTELDTLSFPDHVFNIFGTNSGGVKGTARYDKTNKTFTFAYSKQFFAGEVVTVGFGPVKTMSGDTITAYHWQFTVKITKATPPYFKTPVTYPVRTYAPLFAVDMDNDGSLDIISTNGIVFYNNGDGTFSKTSYKPELIDLSYVSDLNNDGNLDIICTEHNFMPNTKIFIGDGNGNFTLSQDIYPGITVLAVGDIDGDNYNDFIAVNGNCSDSVMTLQVYINDMTGYFYPDSTYKINSLLGVSVILADINKDGSLDMIVVNPGFLYPRQDRFSGLQVFLNDGKGHFTNSQNLLIRDLYNSEILSNDYNNDGNTDFALFNTVTGSKIVTSDNSGNLSLMNMLNYGGGEYGGVLITGDMNGDNKIDLLLDAMIVGIEAGDSADASFSIFLNSQVNPFSSYQNITGFQLGKLYNNANGEPVLGDVNNDGAIDLIHGLSSGFTTILINTDSTNSIKDQSQNINNYALEQNYPNPFNGQTVIKYNMKSGGKIKIALYDLMGREVKVLVNEFQNKGEHEIHLYANNFSSGVYFYQMEVNSLRLTKKMLYIK